jgi:ribonucleoside-diphosphate reductase alpha chain
MFFIFHYNYLKFSQQHIQRMASQQDEMKVLKRNGNLEDISFDKILNRVKNLGNNIEPKLNINYAPLVMKVIDQLYPNIPTKIIDELAAEQCASLSTKHLDYGTLASRIIISNHHKNTKNSFRAVINDLYHFKDVRGQHTPLISYDLWRVVENEYEVIEKFINYDRDFLIDYFGFKTLERAYLMRINKLVVERPQHMWMRVAIGIHGDNLEAIKETYDLMSMKYFTHATPTLFNAGTPRPQLSSCYLISMENDSIDGIYNTLKECASISKWAGGIGLHVHNVRSTGSHIRGTNGTSNGIVPMLRVFNMTARYVDQGGNKRNGSFAIYLEPWHADIFEFLDLKKNHGDEELRARDLFYALWIPSLFMEKVKKDEDWHLFCPDVSPGLADCYGDAFVELYNKYVSENKFVKVVKARELWYKILDSQMETGTPYLLYKDAANQKSNQNNLGTIKSSNLCVAPDTKILTSTGYHEIQTLKDKKVEVWNGIEFSEVVVKQTNDCSELVTVYFSDGSELKCTKYHKFYIQNRYTRTKHILDSPHVDVIEAQHLKNGMKLVKCDYPVIDNNNTLENAYTNGFFSGDGTYTNCGVQPKKCSYKAIENSKYCKRHIAYSSTTDESSDICIANCYEKRPMVTLYHENIKLLEHLNYTSYGEILNNRLNVTLIPTLKNKYYVPINYSLKSKLEWFAGLCDADGCVAHNGNIQTIQVASIHKNFLNETKLMLQTCGISSKVTKCKKSNISVLPNGNGEYKEYVTKDLWRLLVPSNSLMKLIDLGISFNRIIVKRESYKQSSEKFVYIDRIEYNNITDRTFCFNEPKRHAGIFNGVITSNCTEIMEYSDENQTAVCNLASISLTNFVNTGSSDPLGRSSNNKMFDYKKLHHVTQVITRNLNKIIDINYYPTNKTRVSNLLHRPIGIGVQGLADVFALMDLPFDCEQAKRMNIRIFETIYHASLTASNQLAKERDESMRKMISFQDIGNVFSFEPSGPLDVRREYVEHYHLKDDIKKHLPIYAEILASKIGNPPGAYSSFAGSPASNGILQFDMWGITPDNTFYDWKTLKQNIMQYGLRNSLLVAPMPTASTSQILGNNECFEPFTSNIYTRRTIAGEFIIVNKYLMKELVELKMWSTELKDSIVANKGSIQHVDGIPQLIKDKYRTVWEIPMKSIIDMAADRGAYICQSQSLNLWMEDPNYKTLTAMHFYSWQKGLKTGIYYLRRKPRHQPQQFTIEPEKKTTEDDDVCEMCSA